MALATLGKGVRRSEKIDPRWIGERGPFLLIQRLVPTRRYRTQYIHLAYLGLRHLARCSRESC